MGYSPHMTGAAQSDWYPDPFGRYQYRYWDGSQWTHHVATQGQQGVDPPIPSAPVTSATVTSVSAGADFEGSAVARATASSDNCGNKKVQRVVAAAGADGQSGGGTLFTEPVLVVNQKAKLVEINAQYDVFNQDGHRVGAVREVGQGLLKNAFALRPAGNRTRRLQIVDLNGQLLMTLTRPAQTFRSTVFVRDPSGVEIGKIVQKSTGVVRKVRFVLEAGGKPLGTLNGEDRGDWDFSVLDKGGTEVARIARTLKGLTNLGVVKTDTYVVQIPQPSPEPLRSLVIAAALVIDTVLRQGVNDARRGRRTGSGSR